MTKQSNAWRLFGDRVEEEGLRCELGVINAEKPQNLENPDLK